MDDGSPSPTTGGEDGGYAVPPQFPAPPDATGRPAAGPPLVAPEDPAAVWSPAAPPAEPDRWGGAPPHRYGGTALLERTTVSRRPVVAAPVRPLPPAPAAQSWEWERSHGLRNALIAAAAILLVGSLIAAFVVFRQHDDKKPAVTDPPPPAQSVDPSLDPTAGGATATTGPPVIPPVTPAPVTPATTAAVVPATTAPPATAAPPTTKAATPPTTQRPTPTITASPPYTGGPFPTQKPTTTTAPRPTTTTTRNSG